MKLSNLMCEWLYENHKEVVSPQTFLRYECAIKNYILPHPISNRKIKKITPREIQSFINETKNYRSRKTNEGLSSSSINIIITTFKSAFNYALDFNLVKENPCIKVKRSSMRDMKKVDSFTVKEQIKIEQYIESTKNPEYFGILLSLYTGLRIGELLALEWSDIDFVNGTMSINKTSYKGRNELGNWETYEKEPKTFSSIRDIPLPKYIVKLLRDHKRKSKSKNVIARIDGCPISQDSIRRRLRTMTKRLKIRNLNFHALRHTFATRAIESGMDVKTLSEIMGHSNAMITLNTYAHSMTEHKRNMMNNLPRLIKINI